jgi:hypothetical protein
MNRTRWRAPLSIALALGAAAVLAVTSVAVPPAENAMAGWPRQTQGPGGETIDDVATSSSGDVYVVGSTNAAMPGQTHVGLSDLFLIRYDKYGRHKWTRQLGSAADESVFSLAISGSAIYVAGQTTGVLTGANMGSTDGFLARYDTNGNVKWLRQFGTAGGDYVTDVAVSGSDVFLVGATEGTFPNNAPVQGPTDAFVARYSTSGTLKSVKQFGTPAEDNAHAVTVTGSDVYIGGLSYGNIGGGGVDPDGDMFVARLDRAGTQKALIQVGSTELDYLYDIAVRGTGLYVAGYTLGTFPNASPIIDGTVDSFLVRYDRGLTTAVWTRQLAAGGNDVVTAINLRSNDVYIAGQTNGAVPGFTNLGNNDGFVARYDTNGTQVWIRQFGTDDTDGVGGIATRSSDNYGGTVVVAGGTFGSVWGQPDAAGMDGFVATFLK